MISKTTYASGRQFVDSYSPRGYSDDVKQQCLKMYLNGMGFRGIERVTGVNHNTIITCGRLSALVTDGYVVYSMFIDDIDHRVSKTYMTRVEAACMLE